MIETILICNAIATVGLFIWLGGKEWKTETTINKFNISPTEEQIVSVCNGDILDKLYLDGSYYIDHLLESRQFISSVVEKINEGQLKS